MRSALTAAVALGLVIVVSMGMYLLHRNSNYSANFGSVDAADRVNVDVWINRLDTTSATLAVEISSVTPTGTLADADGGFRRDVVLTTSALGAPIAIKQQDTGADTAQLFPVNGTVTDYPFDRYTSAMTFDVTDDDGAVLPVVVTIWSSDPFFQHVPVAGSDAEGHGAAITLTSTRSTPTMVFAIFVMVLMLGLAAAAVTASYYILRWRRGLLFPACSMMAALLFALIPFRNAVPGDPPIGSVIDFASFFIAETIISVALIASVVIGYRVEMAKELAAPSVRPTRMARR